MRKSKLKLRLVCLVKEEEVIDGMGGYSSKKSFITPFELTVLLITITIGIGATSLPNIINKFAKQDAWIATALGGIYPLYVVLIAIYLSKKFPQENILNLSKRYLGKHISTFFNIIFLLGFLTYLPGIISNGAIVFKTYIIMFMSFFKIYLVLVIFVIFAANKGLKVLGRMSIINFFTLAFILITSLAILKKGTYLNILPLFGSGGKNILKSSFITSYAYAGIEFIFLLYPNLEDKSKLKKAGMRAVFFIVFFYTWIVFISIYYMGTDIVAKSIWPFFTATEALQLDIINSFRYIFITLWLSVTLSNLTIFYYFNFELVKQMINIDKKIILYIVVGSFSILLANKYYSDRILRMIIIERTSLFSTVYNFIYITIIFLFAVIKKGDSSEKA